MKLTRETEYALRLLIHVYDERKDLVQDRQQKITLAELSKAINVSKGQLGKITAMLVDKGYLSSTTGRSGGLSATKTAKDISVGEILELFEDTAEPIDCAAFGCPLMSRCNLSSILLRAELDFIERLKKISLADVF